MLIVFETLSHIILTLALGYYLITALQWYGYRIKRVFFHFHKPQWHLLFFILPVMVYYLAGIWGWIYFYFAYLPWLVVWAKKLDKKVLFTARVKRFFAFLLFATILQNALCLISPACENFGLLLPLIASIVLSAFYEKILFKSYYNEAKKSLMLNSDLKIIAITASYGKTSIKNFLYHILSKEYRCYHTPRSVNTLGGLVQDVNTSLPKDCQIYIAEAGARERGDIAEIAAFLEPHIAIVGQIGPQHIEYFKTLETIRNTKMELIHSPRLEHAFVHVSTNALPSGVVKSFGNELKEVEATLEGTRFSVELDGHVYWFETVLLGAFHAQNLLACIHAARALGMSIEAIQEAINSLTPVPHRLSPMRVGGKLILDDSYNGNREGMEASYRLASTHKGRKILITPGIIESTPEENQALGKVMNGVFDIVIITGSANAQTLLKELKNPKVHLLKDKSQLESLLARETTSGDLILFSNDAPSYI
jgi:UDP-N-acetylmuramoyl-tripeptide--D-alanyl-D-alanine ligase